MLHSTLFLWTFNKEENWRLLNIYQGLRGQLLRNAHCTEGVLQIGCHEISKKFQPVLEPDWSAAQQYNHMFQRSTVVDLDNWILDFDFFNILFLSLSQPLHLRQLIVAKQMDLKRSLGSNFIQSNQILLKKKWLHRMFVQRTSVAMTVKQKHIRAKPLRVKYIRRLVMHEGFLL